MSVFSSRKKKDANGGPRYVLVAGACACAVFVVALILAYRPFFGLMDDHLLLQSLDSVKRLGLFGHAVDSLKKDMTWGMFRPFYPFMAFFLYGPTREHPTLLFLLNAVLVLLVLAGFSAVCARLYAKRGSRAELTLVGLLLALAFPWTHDLFFHPSLQEKMVLAAGAGSILLWSSERFVTSRFPVWALGALLALAVGLSTKAQFVVFLPALFCLQWASNRTRAAVLAAISAIGVLSLKKLAASGSYTARYGSFETIRSSLMAPGFWLIFALAAVSIVLAFRSRKGGERIRALAPAAALAGFLAVFLPWGMGGYLLSLAGPLVGWAGLRLWPSLGGRRAAAAAALAVLAITMVGYRDTRFFSRLGDLGRIVSAASTFHATQLNMPCQEGALAMTYYFRRYGATELTARFTTDASKRGLWLYDSKWCVPLAGAPAGRALYTPRLSGGFQVLETR